MKRSVLLALALAFVACATVNDTNFAPGRVVVSSTYDLPTCATAASVGELCASGDIETNANLDVAGTATLTGAVSTGALTPSSLAVTGAATVGGAATVTGVLTANAGVVITPRDTYVNFLKEQWAPIFAKTTRAIVTEADTQEDFFYVGHPQRYFEYFQDGAVATAVTGFSPSTAGWVFPGDDEADTGFQLTEGILLGQAHSFLVGTDAFQVTVVFYLPEIDQHAELMVGFRVLGAYAVADDATELATAYDRKVLIGLEGAAAALVQYTSIASGTDVGPTTCTGTDPVDGDVVALKVAVSAAGVTSVSYGKAAATSGSYAHVQAAATTALAALTADTLCNAAAVTLDAATVVVPTIIMASANGTGANTSTIVSYSAGLQ
jgi:hypothetical protein